MMMLMIRLNKVVILKIRMFLSVICDGHFIAALLRDIGNKEEISLGSNEEKISCGLMQLVIQYVLLSHFIFLVMRKKKCQIWIILTPHLGKRIYFSLVNHGNFLKNSSTGTLFSFFFYMMGSLSTGNTINLMNVLFSWNTFRVIFPVVLAGMYEMSFGKMMMECFFLALIIIYL